MQLLFLVYFMMKIVLHKLLFCVFLTSSFLCNYFGIIPCMQFYIHKQAVYMSEGDIRVVSCSHTQDPTPQLRTPSILEWRWSVKGIRIYLRSSAEIVPPLLVCSIASSYRAETLPPYNHRAENCLRIQLSDWNIAFVDG